MKSFLPFIYIRGYIVSDKSQRIHNSSENLFTLNVTVLRIRGKWVKQLHVL